MGVGYLGLFDRIDHTASSEWSSRGVPITTEQVHHTAYPNDEGSRRLMDAGGRQVSANGLLLRDGTLVEVVPGQYRAFASASAADRYSLTVETVNQTGSPTWEISEAQRMRLAKLNRDMAAAGIGIAVGARGTGGIQGHSEVPGSYPTACPGPDMQLDHIAALAASGNIGTDPAPTIAKEDDDMLIYESTAPSSDGTIPAGFSFMQGADGVIRPLSSVRRDSYDFHAAAERGDARVPVRVNKWHGDDILDEAKWNGLAEWDGVEISRGHFLPKLTGRIIFPGRTSGGA